MLQANLYVECLDKPLLPMLLDAELFLMLRFSLDDSSRPIITASLAALCSLLVNHFDEVKENCYCLFSLFLQIFFNFITGNIKWLYLVILRLGTIQLIWAACWPEWVA